MTKRRVEMLVCWAMALVLGARGMAATWQESYWWAGRLSPPRHFSGLPAQALGGGEIGAAICFIGVWLAFSVGRRTAGVAMIVCGALLAFAGFGYGLLAPAP